MPIGPDDTAGSLYFDKIFPLGIQALVEAADLVVSGRATETTQDESQATYEGWVREAESRITWAHHVDFVYDLIRGCNPAPGAWTMYGDKKLYLFDAKKITAPTFGAVRGKKIGEVVAAGPAGLRILAQGGYVEVSRVRLDDGPKIASTEAEIPVGNDPRQLASRSTLSSRGSWAAASLGFLGSQCRVAKWAKLLNECLSASVRACVHTELDDRWPARAATACYSDSGSGKRS